MALDCVRENCSGMRSTAASSANTETPPLGFPCRPTRRPSVWRSRDKRWPISAFFWFNHWNGKVESMRISGLCLKIGIFFFRYMDSSPSFSIPPHATFTHLYRERAKAEVRIFGHHGLSCEQPGTKFVYLITRRRRNGLVLALCIGTAGAGPAKKRSIDLPSPTTSGAPADAIFVREVIAVHMLDLVAGERGTLAACATRA